MHAYVDRYSTDRMEILGCVMIHRQVLRGVRFAEHFRLYGAMPSPQPWF
jgi:phenylalanyl-tRNA synthetase alpha subunit